MRTSDSQTVRQSDKNDTIVITVGAGEIWDDVVLFAVEHGYWGIENLSYIPGAVGAAPVQNIGAYGVELADVFESLVAFDNETLNEVTFSKSMCEFGYRDSLFKRTPGRYVIVSVTLRLSKKPNPILTYKPLDALMSKEELLLNDIRQKVIEIRKAKLPDWKIYPNAGSFFKNPVLTEVEAEGFRLVYPTCPIHQADEGGYKVPAAWLIEHVAHAKGLRIGDVGTWPNQPLVIVNYGNAHADDVTLFAATISKTIQDVTGIILEPEVRRVP